MNEKILIFSGLALFLLGASYPFWQINQAEEIPKVSMQTKGPQCVEPVDYMRKNHMKLLNEWRDSVVRDDDRFHVMPDGSKVEKSLTKTCLDCHISKERFCEECHATVSVKPYCWECHLTPKSGGHIELAGIEIDKVNKKILLENLLVKNQSFVENAKKLKEE